ncbi:trypsin-like peptidase domain-containing protein [Flavihumibacter sp.]|uniref:trypsin-like peptidase domain-containing protein n=1 Tax=Flavihumibacter sp. TaxID=1913981 RepID=UPI002FC900AA
MKRNAVFIPVILVAMALIAWLSYKLGQKNNPPPVAQPAAQDSYPSFVQASRNAVPGVVHIKTVLGPSAAPRFSVDAILGSPSAEKAWGNGSGSGVCVSPDGYIATNGHVVENALRILVVFPDRREFEAKLVGTDPDTDLALLKVDAKNLPFVKSGNSDEVEVGEWVLAIGYPFSLNTTITAGIISAKGRSIGVIENTSESPNDHLGSTAVESFIQTDAAINTGNSGGALVNREGELIGINTAIATRTGSYAGYAFAIPVNLAKKILDDLTEFGVVKRGVLGVAFPAPADESQWMKQMGIKPGSVSGVLITGIMEGSAAAGAGLEEGDIIQQVNGNELFSSAEFSEQIARHRPGDTIDLAYLRNGNKQKIKVILQGERKSPAGVNDEKLREIYNKLGASFTPISRVLKERFGLNAGVVVTRVDKDAFFDKLGIPAGTIIAQVNGREVNSTADIEEAMLANPNTRMRILGIAPDGSWVAFSFSFGT